MTINRSFGCGHENPPGNRFCGVCGAAQLNECPACHGSNPMDATYCNACGRRLDGAAAAAAAESLREQEVIRWAADRRGRNAPSANDEEVVRWATDRRGRNPVPDVDEPDDDLIDDADRRGQPLATAAVVALVLALLAVVGYTALAQHTIFLERIPEKRDARVSAPATDPKPSPAPHKRQAVVPSVAPSPSPPPPSPPPPAPRAPAPQVTAPQVTAQASPPPSEPAAAAQETKVAAPITLPPRQAPAEPSERTSRETVKQAPAVTADDNSEPPTRVAATPARTSEERMAAYLVDEFGPRRAAEKALSNAAWYDESRSERQYWRRVAEAVGRRGGR